MPDGVRRLAVKALAKETLAAEALYPLFQSN